MSSFQELLHHLLPCFQTEKWGRYRIMPAAGAGECGEQEPRLWAQANWVKSRAHHIHMEKFRQLTHALSELHWVSSFINRHDKGANLLRLWGIQWLMYRKHLEVGLAHNAKNVNYHCCPKWMFLWCWYLCLVAGSFHMGPFLPWSFIQMNSLARFSLWIDHFFKGVCQILVWRDEVNSPRVTFVPLMHRWPRKSVLMAPSVCAWSSKSSGIWEGLGAGFDWWSPSTPDRGGR